MKIYADQNILALESNFSRYGELHLFDGRSVESSDLIEADALLVRSTTQVNESLLAGSNIRFVGTATSGVDHIDANYLRQTGIGFADAKGSNANAVVDYCFSALACAAIDRGFSLSDSSVGIVGAGAVGGLFASKLEKLGIEVRCCDPFLANRGIGARDYFSLPSVLACDVISLHVPLSSIAPHPTANLLGPDELSQLVNGAVLINACRGGVVDEAALKMLLSQRSDLFTVFDVWAGEPAIDPVLVEAVDFATPHIAGYSVEAKSNATRILAQAFEAHFELNIDAKPQLAADSIDPISLESEADALATWKTLLKAFPLHGISEKFKQAEREGRGATAFDSLRAALLQRREFESVRLVKSSYTLAQQKQLSILGFSFDTP
ncbi:MAG: erythronate-4-phosphate dehydrogenase [Pseudohongiella sp.]|nr:MAG: erythronate-4-phosphate dehydrogenase [Pseudohongiella sp.]